MNKAQVLEKIDSTWLELKAAASGLSNEQMMTPGVTGDWSVKDILGHVSTWEEESLKYLPLILRGEKTPRYSTLYGGIDAFNAQMTFQIQKMTLDEALTRFDQTHLKLTVFLQGVPDKAFKSDARFLRRLKYDTYAHYPEHQQAILHWRSQLG